MGLLSGLFGGGSKTTTTKSDYTPFQADWLKYGFDEAKNLYKDGAPGYFPGDTVADLNQTQLAALNNLGSFAPGSVDAMNNLGNQYANMGAVGTGVLSNLAGSSAPQTSMMTWDQLQGYQPMVNNMVDAATFSAERNARENVLPGINAAGSGNLGSSRAGIAEGVVNRGLAENRQNVATGIYNNLFNQGNATNLANANLTAQNNALMSGVGMNLVNTANQGVNMLGAADAATQNAYNTNLAAGSVLQNQNQNEINAQKAEYDYNANKDMQWLNNYMSMVGGNYGGTTTGTQTTPTASPFQQMLGVGLQFGGAALTGGINPFTMSKIV
jgi:hypothetical protein